MIKKIKNADRSVLAIASVGLAIIFFLAFNALINTALTSNRLDLTQDQLFTLSDGTKELLSTIDEPIDVRLYYSRRFNEIGPDIARHATRVTELLGEYERLSSGKIRFQVFDPEPFSPEEDLAVSDGLRGLPFDQSGELVYFGVAGTNSTDDTDSIGYLTPERGPFLEYDLTRLIHNLANPDKARITILSDLPLQGTKFDNYKEWLIVEGMRQFFDVQFIDRDMILAIDDPNFGKVLHPGVVPKMSGENPGGVAWPGPDVGAHTNSVLREVLKMEIDEIKALRMAGVL